MKTWLFLLTVLLVIPRFGVAQETPEPAEWTAEQRCITAPSLPPDGWTYDGVIFTFRWGEGIHARRADVPTRYYVAFDGSTEFAVAGSISPDGRWLAVPAGTTRRWQFGQPAGQVAIEYRIYSTDPAHTLYRIPLREIGFGTDYVPPVRWLDNQRLVRIGVYGEGTTIFSPFDEIVTPLIVPEGTNFHSASPDGTRLLYVTRTNVTPTPRRGFYLSFADDPSIAAIRVPIASSPQWKGDSSGFLALLSDQNQIGVFDRDGNLLDSIPIPQAHYGFSIAPSGNQVAFRDGDRTIHIADFATRTITDTCIETPYSVVFSPDGQNLAFGLEPAGYIYILDLEAWEAYRIDLAANDVIGWYPIS